jgi:hypothetical protein
MKMTTNTLALIAIAALALGALIFGLGGGISVGNLVLWAVMMVVVASAVMLYGKPRVDNGKSHVREKK